MRVRAARPGTDAVRVATLNGTTWNLTDGVDYLWDYADQHGIADCLFVVIGSDFGRTNFYNADREGPLAHRQLRDHGARPEVDEPGGGGDRPVCTSRSGWIRAR